MSLPLRWIDSAPLVPIRPSKLGPKVVRRRSAISLRRSRVLVVPFVIGALCSLAVVSGAFVLGGIRGGGDLRLANQAPGHSLALASVNVDRNSGFISIAGSVNNRSSRSFNNVEVMIELLDGNGRTVGLESALVAFDPLKPGETSPFKAEVIDNPRADSFRMHFRQLGGSEIN